MSTIAKRKLGRTDVAVTGLGFGGVPLGELFEKVSEAQAQMTLQAAWDVGIRYFDTAPLYGYGKSEHRIGRFLREQPPGEFVLSTKVGRLLRATRDLDSFDRGMWAGGLPFDSVFDYSYDGLMRSYEDSLQRLGLNAIDLLLIHDIDYIFHLNEARVIAYMAQLFTSGWRALDELRSSGQIKGVGAGINQLRMIPRFLDMVDLDFFILAMPYTLLDQDALDGAFPERAERGIGMVARLVSKGSLPSLRTGTSPTPSR